MKVVGNDLAMGHPLPHLSVVIPVCKAENCLDELYLRPKAALESHLSPDFEIVQVEDCGGDASKQMIERLASAGSHVRGSDVITSEDAAIYSTFDMELA